MDLIYHNPYRIIGILSNTSERELQKRKARIKAYTRVSQEVNSDYDFQILGTIPRTEDSINRAFSNIEQNQDKVNYSLFWFLNVSPFDNTAIEYLKNGNEEKAIEIWEKVTTNKEVNSKNFSAFSNFGTFKLLSKRKSDIKVGIEVKLKLIESEYFENFVHTVADETYTIDNQKQSEKLIDELLTQFKNQYSSSETLQFFSGCNGTTQKYLSKKFTEEPLHKIESQIEKCKRKRKLDKSSAYEFGLKLAANCKDDLSLLNSILGNADLKYKAIADQLANEIMQCGIDYFNECQENDSNENYLELAQKLTKIADRIAVGKLAKDRAKDSLVTLAEMKDQEINQAIHLLKSIKDAYETNERQLMAQVFEQSRSLGSGQSINWTKVTELIRNSIDWDKAIELINNVIPKKNVQKIKNVQNASKISEYKKLVEFILDKLSYSHKSRIQYLQYWQEVQPTKSTNTSSPTRTISSSNTTRTASSSSSSWAEENPGCLISIICLVIGAILLANDVGFGGFLIFVGLLAHKIDS
ncbi:hypothetical protein OE09_1192 [Flavobacteriaceae bacterium MAR_2010_72]|nr:hypothetical protein OE09_1192 [Flavobacteriaceae bacterium MAR_2010_72]